MDDWGNPLNDYHEQGQIISGACWDVRQALVNDPNVNPNLLVFNALFYHTRNFLDFANALVDADDDDDNLGNGTPHLSTIRQKFYARKIYFTAGPPQAPQSVTLTGAIGAHPVISWAANHESDLSGYKLYRKVIPYESVFSLVATLNTSTTSYTDGGIIRKSVGTSGPYAQYYVKAYDATNYYSDASSTVSTGCENPPKGVVDLVEKPTSWELFDAYPNPFNPVTTVRYAMAQDAQVSLVVYNAQGQEIAVLANGLQSGGYYETRFTGEHLASGIYFVRMRVSDALGRETYRRVIKLLLTK